MRISCFIRFGLFAQTSIGISIVIAQLTEGGRRTYAVLSQHINPFNQALQMPDVSSMINLGTDKGRAIADVMVQLQAQIIAFSHDYEFVMIFILYYGLHYIAFGH